MQRWNAPDRINHAPVHPVPQHPEMGRTVLYGKTAAAYFRATLRRQDRTDRSCSGFQCAFRRTAEMFVLDLFLVLDDLAVELVDQQVDGSIHIVILTFDKYVLA